MQNGQADGDALPLSQHKRQQRVAGVVVVFAVALQPMKPHMAVQIMLNNSRQSKLVTCAARAVMQ